MARAHPKPDHVRVRVLGASEITVGSRRVGMSTEALFALTLFVTTRAGERLTRAEVLETFWPGGDEEARRHSLRQMLYRLRQKGFRFAEEGEHLLLDAALVDSDVRECVSPSWPDSASAEAVEAALTLGPTFSARLPSTFLEWFEGVRAAVSHQARKAAFRWIATSRMQGRWAELERWSRAVLGVDPLNEEATLALAEAASMLGSKTLALEILDGYLAEVTGTDASLGKPAQVLRKRIAERRASWLPSGPREVALIGRAEEMSVLTQAIETTAIKRGRSVLLVGPSGYGKSRLLAEAREYAVLRGVRCIGVRAEATLAHHPMSFVRSLAKELIGQPGSAAADPNAMRTLRSLVNGGAGANEQSLSPVPLTTEQDVCTCLLEVIRALSDEARVLITIDDLHVCDEHSVSVLTKVLSAVRDSRCLLITAVQNQALTRLNIGSQGGEVRQIRLKPLSAGDSEQLAVATASAHNRRLSTDDMSRIARRSGGHPLFVRELALASAHDSSGRALPETLAALVASSVAALTPDAVRVLRVVVLLAECATAYRVRLASGLTHDAFLLTVEALSRDGLVHHDDARILRLHDSWRDAVHASTPDAAAAALALVCAEALRGSTEAQDVSTSQRLATLYRLAGENEEALRHSLSSVDGLLSAGLYESAIQSLASLTPEANSPLTRSRLLVRESVALQATGRAEEALVAAEAVWRSRTLQSPANFPEHVLAVCVASDCHIKLDRADTGPSAELVSIARNAHLDPEDRARACLTGIRMLSNAGGVEDFSEFAAIARELESRGTRSTMLTLTLLIYAAEAGTATDVHSIFERIRQSEYGSLSIGDRCLILRCSAHALRIAGDFGEAVAIASSAYALAETHSMEYSRRIAAELLCHIHLDFGSTTEARRWYEKMVVDNGTNAPSTASSIEHTRDRLQYVEGTLEQLISRVAGRLEVIGRIGATHGKASELALAGAVLSSAGRTPEAMELISAALSSVEPFIGRHAADFAVDTCLRTSQSCGIAERAEAIARRHIEARVLTRKLRFAPIFTSLVALSEKHPATCAAELRAPST